LVLFTVATMGVPLSIKPDRPVGDTCGHDGGSNTINICQDGLKCENQRCERWVVENREPGSECGKGLYDGTVDIFCIGGVACVDGHCLVENVPYHGKCDEARRCEGHLDCIDGRCRKHLFYVAVDYLSGVANRAWLSLS
jgi:hypothetical protein